MTNDLMLNNEVVIEKGEIMAVSTMDLANPSEQQMYCTIKADDKKTKVDVFNAINSPDEKLSEHIGEVINLKNVIAHPVQLTDEVTGEIIECLRTILIDDKGVSYEAVSGGVANALQRIMQIFGQPETWEHPLKVKAVQKATRNGNNKVTTLKVEN